jgi:hypothetical protein
MNRIIKVSIIFGLTFGIIPTVYLNQPLVVNAESSNLMRRKINNPIIPIEHLVDISQLSTKAQKAANNVKTWSDSKDMVWIAIYREGKENYVFFNRQDQFLIFKTNPEKGGEYTIPKGKFFAVSDTMLDKIITKQDFNGRYRFKGTTNGSYSENYITPLVEVDDQGYEKPNQDKEPYWALHSPPYEGKTPSENLNTAGNSCIRLKIKVAKFIQSTVAKEIIIEGNTDFNVYLTRYDPSEYQ